MGTIERVKGVYYQKLVTNTSYYTVVATAWLFLGAAFMLQKTNSVVYYKGEHCLEFGGKLVLILFLV